MNSELKDQAKELRRKYHRDWQRNNKDKVRGYNNRYWNKKAEQQSNV